MGSGAPRFRLCTHNDMKILVTLLLLGALLAATEGKRRGGKPKKARSGRGGERSWHIAGEEGETGCGNSTEIFTTETPSSLCTEAGSNFCICATRGDLEDEEEKVKWKPERDEEAAKKRKQEKKKISAEAKARKKEMRRKMRQKLKGREGRQEKMKRRKQSHRAAMAESQNEEE